MEKRFIQHGSEVACFHFQIAQVRSFDVTGKKCIATLAKEGMRVVVIERKYRP